MRSTGHGGGQGGQNFHKHRKPGAGKFPKRQGGRYNGPVGPR
jgi:hypothetical protein